jgi:hypothetical protein
VLLYYYGDYRYWYDITLHYHCYFIFVLSVICHCRYMRKGHWTPQPQTHSFTVGGCAICPLHYAYIHLPSIITNNLFGCMIVVYFDDRRRPTPGNKPSYGFGARDMLYQVKTPYTIPYACPFTSIYPTAVLTVLSLSWIGSNSRFTN